MNQPRGREELRSNVSNVTAHEDNVRVGPRLAMRRELDVRIDGDDAQVADQASKPFSKFAALINNYPRTNRGPSVILKAS